jgi:hypothetical protein
MDEDLPFPLGIRIAGWIWALTGVIGALWTVAFFLVGVAALGPVVGLCGTGFGCVFAWMFLSIGVQTARGETADTLRNGIGSVGIASLSLLATAIMLYVCFTKPGGGGGTRPLIAISLFGTSGVLLMIAGVLAIRGRAGYRSWREVNGPPPGEDPIGDLADRVRARRGEGPVRGRWGNPN